MAWLCGCTAPHASRTKKSAAATGAAFGVWGTTSPHLLYLSCCQTKRLKLLVVLRSLRPPAAGSELPEPHQLFAQTGDEALLGTVFRGCFSERDTMGQQLAGLVALTGRGARWLGGFP